MAGRVLSAKNETKLRQALEALSEVLVQLEKGEETDERSALPHMEHRTYAIDGLEVRRAGAQPSIAGYAAVFNRQSVMLYGYRETILPGAFADSLMGDIRALWQHDSTQVLGRTKAGTLRLWEDDQGLAFELTPPDTQTGRDAVTLIERGDVDQMSFGFNVPTGGDGWAEDDDGTPLRLLRKADLVEISPVTFPAYPDTAVAIMREAPDWVQRALTHGVNHTQPDELRARIAQAYRQRYINLLGLGGY